MTTKLLKSSDQIRFYLSHVTSASDNVIEFFINASISYCLVEFFLEINIIIDRLILINIIIDNIKPRFLGLIYINIYIYIYILRMHPLFHFPFTIYCRHYFSKNFLFLDVPTPPGGVHASDIYHDSCVLSWSSPSTDGGSPITGYHIEQRLLVRPSWLRITTTPVSGTRHHVTGLMDGQSYQYRVFAENRIGLSEPSAPSATVLAKDPWDKPGAPGLPQISDVTRRSCKLSWLPPTSDGGDDIRTYVIEYKVADAFKWIRANEGERILDTSYRVTGLHGDLDYEFRVAAENRGGIGPYSELSMPVRALDPQGYL